MVPVEEDNVSTNLGLTFDLTARLTLFAQYAEGFRPPNYDEANQSFVNRAFGYATVPNPELRPETSRGLELGLKAGGERARWSFSVFQNRYEDFIDTQFIGQQDGISLFQQVNLGEAEIRGAEYAGQWRPSPYWRLHGALAWARGDDKQSGVSLDSVEPLAGVLGLRWARPDDRWGVETLLTAVDAKDRVSAGDRVTADAYNVVDLVGHYRIAGHSVFRLGVYNLFDETYAPWTNIQGLAASEEETIARAQAPGTHLRLGFSTRF